LKKKKPKAEKNIEVKVKVKTFKYRLFPTKKQGRLLDDMLEECRQLYNHRITPY
jgi:hypothetical protein